MDFNGKVVLVTGAGGGIGAAIVGRFAQGGAKLALTDVGQDALDKTVKALSLTEENCLCIPANVTDEEAVKDLVGKVHAHYGRIDVLVNVAGIGGPSATIADYTFADYKKVLAVNLDGVFLMMKYVLPIMQAQKSGAVISLGSVSGMFGYPYESAYGASKAAVIHLTKTAANEYGADGVRVNAVSPGWVNTDMMKAILDSYKDVGIEDSSDNVTLGPMGRAAEPAEIANAVAFLASEEASYVNGTNFLVDGGMTLG